MKKTANTTRGAKAQSDNAARTPPVTFLFAGALLIALPLAWRWTPLAQWIHLQTIVEWQESLRNHPAAPLSVIAAYMIGSLICFPVTVLSLATVAAFGPFWGNLYGLVGWLASAAQGFLLGRFFGTGLLRWLPGERLAPLVDRAQHRGFLTVLALRVVPVASFTLVNLFVGASGIRFTDFFLASAVGRLPGMLTLTLFGVHLEYALRQPELLSYGLLVAAIIIGSVTIPQLLRRFSRHAGQTEHPR